MQIESCAPLAVSDDEFQLFQRIVYQWSGIFLSPVKRALLAARLSRRIRQLGLRSFGEYYRVVSAAGPEERRILLDSICTNETHFFREPAQFDFLDRVIVPSLMAERRPRHLSVWSAACSTGQEPFSIAMALHHRLAPSGWTIDVLATDLSTRALEAGRKAEWPIESAAEIPSPYLHRYMLKGRQSKEGIMRAGPVLRSLVRFGQVNLSDASYPMATSFDLIFCRNVMIYFDAASKKHVFDRLLAHLVPGGYLFLGHAESGTGWNEQLVPVRPAICQYRPRSAA
ncbi:MAG TPA: protein-glutamate O-methyltransferase CheR [Thermoanaerobaculia bacterium]|nr:protein-glutamate O-methyltransferase CheR [Thermoanaerobaculia bacterium]